MSANTPNNPKTRLAPIEKDLAALEEVIYQASQGNAHPNKIREAINTVNAKINKLQKDYDNLKKWDDQFLDKNSEMAKKPTEAFLLLKGRPELDDLVFDILLDAFKDRREALNKLERSVAGTLKRRGVQDRDLELRNEELKSYEEDIEKWEKERKTLREAYFEAQEWLDKYLSRDIVKHPSGDKSKDTTLLELTRQAAQKAGQGKATPAQASAKDIHARPSEELSKFYTLDTKRTQRFSTDMIAKRRALTIALDKTLVTKSKRKLKERKREKESLVSDRIKLLKGSMAVDEKQLNKIFENIKNNKPEGYVEFNKILKELIHGAKSDAIVSVQTMDSAQLTSFLNAIDKLFKVSSNKEEKYESELRNKKLTEAERKKLYNEYNKLMVSSNALNRILGVKTHEVLNNLLASAKEKERIAREQAAEQARIAKEQEPIVALEKERKKLSDNLAAMRASQIEAKRKEDLARKQRESERRKFTDSILALGGNKPLGKWTDGKLYEVIKNLNAQFKNLTDNQRRLIDKKDEKENDKIKIIGNQINLLDKQLSTLYEELEIRGLSDKNEDAFLAIEREERMRGLVPKEAQVKSAREKSFWLADKKGVSKLNEVFVPRKLDQGNMMRHSEELKQLKDRKAVTGFSQENKDRISKNLVIFENTRKAYDSTQKGVAQYFKTYTKERNEQISFLDFVKNQLKNEKNFSDFEKVEMLYAVANLIYRELLAESKREAGAVMAKRKTSTKSRLELVLEKEMKAMENFARAENLPLLKDDMNALIKVNQFLEGSPLRRPDSSIEAANQIDFLQNTMRRDSEREEKQSRIEQERQQPKPEVISEARRERKIVDDLWDMEEEEDQDIERPTPPRTPRSPRSKS